MARGRRGFTPMNEGVERELRLLREQLAALVHAVDTIASAMQRATVKRPPRRRTRARSKTAT